ncbi:CBS domain-containing protein [Lederbergia galactosidilytica]|uniref:CBS domain-containing membrane protein n=1 Tax=Lederbergia galactosidilytica TaxID=217031 RepID=A0A0Q9YL44_9BACI|nr:CBS domain-containing protein [Lederbergia galactosidilytica]KRG15706.1 CBS domain-containing membrane protein [Virgibacillus soli]KRG16760.1 CBS domain-containing membrane protein [Lederbergia galactosidilytica]MBP1916796.1 CBS domain-containing protein [Lederbergia galactosidilytica]OAK68524.1 CBS domain-containing membrane protein [Lederbergia galactosidilytica]
MKVRDFMITNVFTVTPLTTVRDLLSVLNSNRIGGVPVVDEKGNLAGMVSDGDVLRYLAPKLMGVAGLVYMIDDGEIEDVIKEKLNTPVKEIMTKRNLLFVSPNEDFETVLRLLSQHRLKKLPVLNRAGRVIGVISRGDIIDNISKKIIPS